MLATDWTLGRFCYKCGAGYPWTVAALEAARELVALDGKLSAAERDALRRTFDDLITDTPRTSAAIAKFKILAPRLGRETAQAVRDIVVDVATEAVKKQIGL